MAYSLNSVYPSVYPDHLNALSNNSMIYVSNWLHYCSFKIIPQIMKARHFETPNEIIIFTNYASIKAITIDNSQCILSHQLNLLETVHIAFNNYKYQK